MSNKRTMAKTGYGHKSLKLALKYLSISRECVNQEMKAAPTDELIQTRKEITQAIRAVGRLHGEYYRALKTQKDTQQ